MSSPSVVSKERDVSFNVNRIESNASSTVGLFRWGPVNEPMLITTNESELLRKVGRPDKATTQYFHSIVNYMTYVTPLYVVRAIDDAVALNAAAAGSTPKLIKNEGEYLNANLDDIPVLARYPGTLGNTLKVSFCDDTAFSDWDYADEFDYAPQPGEFNLVVIDEDGQISGAAGSILEKYELMTTVQGSKKSNGTTANIVKAIQDQSNYLWIGDVDAIDFEIVGEEGIFEVSLEGGVEGNSASADFQTAINVLDNAETIDIVSSFASVMPTVGKTHLIDVLDSREDAIAFVGPELSQVYNNPTAASDVVVYFNTEINKNTSYAVYIDNWKMVYDKYNDENIWIPTCSDVAALHARVFVQAEPWFSPAGLNRGQLKNVIKLAWNPNKNQRDILYKESINSVIAMPGEGTVLWGDKTALRRPSAFDRINVRSLFIVLKKSIAESAKYQLFEINDQITRTVFRNATDRYLSSVQGRRGIRRYQVICDESNNTAQVLDSNEFVGDIFIDPQRSINTIKLNFVVVSSGVEFSEIEGAA